MAALKVVEAWASSREYGDSGWSWRTEVWRWPRGLRLATGDTVTLSCTLTVSPSSGLAVIVELMGGIGGATRVGRGPLNASVLGRFGGGLVLLSKAGDDVVIVEAGCWLSALFTLPSRGTSVTAGDDDDDALLLLWNLLPQPLLVLSTLLSRLLLPLLPPLKLCSIDRNFRSLMRLLRLVL